MKDTQLSAGIVLAWVLWCTTAIGVILTVIYDTRPIAITAVVTSVSASTATIRSFLVSQSALMCNVFAAGRSVGRSEASEGLTIVAPRTP